MTIIIPSAPPGQHEVKVTVIGRGESRYTESFSYTVRPEIKSITPTRGAMGGIWKTSQRWGSGVVIFFVFSYKFIIKHDVCLLVYSTSPIFQEKLFLQ